MSDFPQGDALSGEAGAVFSLDVLPELLTLARDAQRLSPGMLSPEALRTRMRFAMDDLAAAQLRDDEAAYKLAASQIAALSILLLVGQRLSAGGS